MVATYSCNSGYSLIGADKLVCTKSGKWDNFPPTCKAIRCENLLIIHNGRTPKPPYGGYWKYGMVATYSCNSGYSLIGADKLVCTESGKWDNFPPTCKVTIKYNNNPSINDGTPSISHNVTPCGNPGEIPNGYYKAPNKTVGNKVTFYCDIGYKMVGKDYRQCTAEGWDGEVPSCEPITCNDPENIPHGYYRTPNKAFGARVTYYCDIGYKIVDRAYRQCTSEGWEGDVPSCEPITCGNPGEIQNGYNSAPNKTIGSKVTFYCDIGYTMLGRDYQKCTFNGWDGEVPSCEPINCSVPAKILNGYYEVANKTFGRIVTFYCNVGYKIVGRDYQQCTAEGWVGDAPSCESINCGDPGSILNGYYKAPKWTVGSNVTFYCDIGYKIIGRDYRQCTAEGWDGEIPLCEPITCGHPGEILNGHYKTLNETVTKKVTVYCDFGYKLVGRAYRQCTAEGWDGDDPSCEPINCGDPGSIPNGYYKVSNWKVGSNVTFYCDIGYKIIGRDYRQCAAEGWDGEIPSCEPITCGHLGEIPNGQYKALNETVPNKVIFYCDTGYKVVGRAYRHCTAKGWDGDDPSCEPINCGNPGSLPNGYYKALNWTIGSHVTFYCDIGYKLISRDYRQCTAEGWDGEVPLCEPITCGYPGKILHGHYKALNETVPNKVIFHCEFGFKMLGRAYRQCTADGWDGDVPTCEPINCGNPGSILHGYYKASKWTVGSNVTFYCDIGYKIIGRDYQQCMVDGWDGEVPSCEPITCGNPGEILNGHYKTSNETDGNKVFYYCDFGYQIVGRDYRQCTAEGWDGDVPSCESITCGNPGEIVNGYYNAPNKTVGNNVTFYCDIGYTMLGNGYRICTPNGWDGQVPSCESINCGNPGSLPNGYYKATNWTTGSNIIFYCDIGYKIMGRAYRQCTAEGWDGEVPSCEPIACGHPGEILNGHYQVLNETLANKVIFHCDVGYKMVGSAYRQCTAEGWDGDVPICEPINCGHPGSVMNGYYKASQWTVGSIVTFYCDIGYKVTGRDYRQCTAEGWDGEVPSCEPITCGNPGEILNGHYMTPNETVGNKVFFYCDFGYKIVGRDYRQCTAEGWDGDVPSCEPISCGNPGSILHGYYKASKWTVGSNATFYCDIGYKISGRDYRQCTADGWDGEVPSCEPITCGNPGEILNGHYRMISNETVGNKVFFYCDFGFKRVGRDYRQCTAQGWDGDVPFCEPITCGSPGEILNGYYNVPNKTVGSKVIFYCDIGFTMLGNNHRKCTTEGWDGEVPSCEPINCGNPGEIQNGYYIASNDTAGNKVTFHCDVGYKMVGGDYRQCTAEGWVGNVPSCEPINCGNPGSLPNGYYKASNWTVGSNITFYCDIGYKIIGRNYRQCTTEGWDGEIPSCESITCGHPGAILNGHYKVLNETIPNKVIFYCDFEYKMVGGAYRQCTAEGWDGDVPTCEPINCGNPGSILHGYYKASKWTVGSNATFYCDIGYKIIGRNYRQCTADGWDGMVPSCEAIICGNPGEILNGHYQTPNDTVGNKVFYYCDFGYKIVGRDYQQCTAEGWDDDVPSCEPITCGNPGEILNGYYNAPNKTVGNKATFYCDSGYTMLGNGYRKCTPEGWDGEIPSCEPISCGNPGEILNGHYKEANETLGNKVIFYCDFGYELVGRTYLQCTAEGWDGDVPSCETITCGNPGEILNGYYSAPNKTFGNMVHFYCDIGYSILGRDYRQCTTEGWDGKAPSCEPINCGNPGKIPNGYYEAPNNTIGNKVIFYCDVGYKLVGRDYRQCTAKGWDGDVPACEPINCGNPGSILNGYYKASKWTVGSNVTFYCEVGYKIIGRHYRQCMADGWDGEIPSCEPIICGNPGEFLNGHYKTPNETVGNKVHFYCDFGYKIVGRGYRQCTAEGWDGDVSSCESITCGNPGEILHGYYNAPNKTVGNNVTFYCDFGYAMLGRDYRKCTPEGWDGEVPSCEPINCGNPGNILNGYYVEPNVTVENKVTFYCNAGYKLLGRDYRQCTAEGWDGDVPSCESQSALVGMTAGINMGVVAVLGFIFCVACCYRKRSLSNKGEYHLASSIPMSSDDNQMGPHSDSCNRPV
ncbi:sushi, von Willebrand factor type A, EGF and pentraxin domain-containing protein 1-like isoform X3 [Chiloscyllium plagiosum]|uniref:sushi, von Willebrand factor type A, EGF and pentraxin domain-containing protein 1-like isoform X3 n=1 Tax=Chiloscyllium plagiosum TaxID=36176 RepID=UPI001CB80A3E|nr:sushi, von Willebrand factor type A, EGF and pentraxin domain-containing protein 1-like isoform X3 [Chiloscyllium plagiosum]